MKTRTFRLQKSIPLPRSSQMIGTEKAIAEQQAVKRVTVSSFDG
ncbi:hypothetical protein [Streptococcus suis]|nr:hypothetical protein [Streptococcus suis]